MTVAEKELLIKKLDEEIKQKDIRLQNLKSSLRDLEVKKESDRKLDQVEIQRERNKARLEVANLKNSLNSQIDQLEQKRLVLDRREAELVKRENEVKDAKYWLDKLAQERAACHEIRRRSEIMMDEAKEKMEIVRGHDEAYNAKKSELEGREKVVKEKEKWWNDKVGELEERERLLRSEAADLEALKKTMEVVNV